MPTYLSPGVYVEEVDAGSRPIEGVGTAVAAFVGLAEDGPVQHADAGEQLDPVHDDVRRLRRRGPTWRSRSTGYFMNGGGNCYVVRIGAERRLERRRAAQRRGPRSSRRHRRPRSARYRVSVDRRRRAARARSPSRSPRPAATAPRDDMFKLVVKRDGEVVEEYDRATLAARQAERRRPWSTTPRS